MDLFLKKCKNPKCGKKFMGTRTQQYCSPYCRATPPRGIQNTTAKPKPKPKVVKKKKFPSLDEIAAKAKELGVSYGKYMEMLTIENERKERMSK